MKRVLFIWIILALLVPALPAFAQEDFERPKPPDGYLAFPWTLAGPTQTELLAQFTMATSCLAYVGGIEAIYHDYQGNREIILFFFFEEDRDPGQVYNDVIWYLKLLYPATFGRYAAVSPNAADLLCG